LAKGGNDKAQRVDHGGDYFQVPRALVRSHRFERLSLRAKCYLYAVAARFDGFNNGRIAVSARELGDAIGSQRYASNKKARIELEEAGFLVVEREYLKGSRMAMEFRLTWIESGSGKHRKPPTNDWKTADVAGEKKILGNRSSTRNSEHVDTVSTERKTHVDAMSTHEVETPPFLVDPLSTLLVSHLSGAEVLPFPGSKTLGNTAGDSRGVRIDGQSGAAGMDLDELRSFARGYLRWAGQGAQSRLAAAANVPGGSLSKFLAGRSLAPTHRLPLQLAIGKEWPLNARQVAR
jgi:hypothetical protein